MKSNIPGDIVECGVWKGGSVVIIACTLLNMGSTNRDLYLFDTFEEMTNPTDEDVSYIPPYSMIYFACQSEHTTQYKEFKWWLAILALLTMPV